MTTRPTGKIPPFGQIFYAISIIGFGVQFIIYAHAVTVLAPAWPAWIPPHPFAAYLAAFALIVAGGALLNRKTARASALSLGAVILAWALLQHLPKVVANLSGGGEWVDAWKAFALSGGALVVAAASTPCTSPRDHLFARVTEQGAVLIPLGRFFIGIFLIICGVEHFIYAQFVALLVPAWIPGPFFWTYFAGAALIAGGLGLMLRKTLKLAATLVGIMIFIWFAILHLPRAFTALHDGNEWTSVFQALALSGVAFLLAQNASRPSANEAA